MRMRHTFKRARNGGGLEPRLCGTCDALNIEIEAAGDAQKVFLQSQRENHLRQAENFYASLRTDTRLAKLNAHIATVTFDFQQNLPLPHIPVGEVFYMRQLWLYVFGVHECGSNRASMYSWPEFIAGKGSNEVVSCLDNFFCSLPEEVTSLYLYSDGCPGQNKNSTVLQYLFTDRPIQVHPASLPCAWPFIFAE